MLKNTGVLIIFLLLFNFSYSQSTKLKGSVKDTVANISVSNAVVALLSPKDSVLKKFTRTAPDGSYSFIGINKGPYILMVMHPLFGDYVDNIEIKSEDETLATIPLTSKSKLLTAIILKSGSPIKIKGDTTIYTADSFKVSANANVEELLKKLPGIQVDKNGEIKAMGEKVEKVLVDGEEFFGDDPGMAIKNLRADAVSEVQVFDKKSDQAEFTGIDDGEKHKTINLKMKEDKKTGYFGKIDVAGGLQKDIDDRYNNNLMYSTFRGKRKLSAFFLTGNTGQDGLSWQDNEKYGGNDNVSMNMDEDGGMNFMWRGGSTDDEPYVNTENGFIKNINTGMQYSNKWNGKQTLNFSPRYNEQDYENITKTLTQERGNDSIVLNTDADDATNIKRYNFKTKLTYDVKLDSANNSSLKFTGAANFYHTESEVIGRSSTNNQFGDKINERIDTSRNKNDKAAITLNIIYKHKFKKARRTFSLSTDLNYLKTDGTNYLQTFNQGFDPVYGFTQTVDQMITPDKSTNKVSSKIVYTEPLSKNYSLELGYQFSYNYGKNDQVTHSKVSGTDKYEFLVDSLTNRFRQTILINTPSFKINYSLKKIKYNFGSGFGFTNFDLSDETVQRDYRRQYTNFFPMASFTYNYKANHSFRFNYSGSTTQPTINQLQPLRNNNDKFNQYIGNPDLRPSFANSFNIQHNSYNFLKDLWTYASVNAAITSNAITDNININYATGEKTTRPINTNGNLSVNIYAGGGGKIKKIESRIWFGPNFSYTRFNNYLNGQKIIANNIRTGFNFNLNKSKDKKYEFSLGDELNYNSNKTSQNNIHDHYITNTVTLDATLYIHKVWSIASDYQYYYRQKTAQSGDALNNSLWNAKAQRTFKSNEFTLYVKVRDILNQNRGIDRYFDGTKFTETRNERLKRYFLVGFAWDFKNKAKKTN
ncbi:MAG: outer membrane beta-barrel family protein [Ferruginibacter sp.]